VDTKKMATDLETMIDADCVASLLQLLADLCADKAEHVQANWQDSKLAGYWYNLAHKIQCVSVYAEERGI
jgi:hypothetical protein